MALSDLLSFENPGFVVFVLGLLMFVAVFQVMVKFIKHKGSAVLLSASLSGIAIWNIYRNNFYGMKVASFFIILLALIVLLKIFISFIKGAKYRFRR